MLTQLCLIINCTLSDHQPAWVRCPWPGTKGFSPFQGLWIINWVISMRLEAPLLSLRTSKVPVTFALKIGLLRGLQVQSRHSCISKWDFQGPRSLWKATEASSWSSLIWQWFSRCNPDNYPHWTFLLYTSASANPKAINKASKDAWIYHVLGSVVEPTHVVS